MNYIFFAIFLGVILFSGTFLSSAFADVISPRHQMKLDFTAEQVICSEGLVKIAKNSSDKIFCVKPTTVEKLISNGWAEKPSAQQIEEIKMKKESDVESVGTITKLTTLKQTTKSIKAGTSTGISGYAYVFDVCSNNTEIRTPEVYITSDSETKSVKLGNMLKPNACYTSSIIIKAADPNSISAELLNHGSISDKIKNLETKISELKERISAIKQNIPRTDDQEPNPDNLNSLTSHKKELKSLQDQLRRYLMVLYIPQSKVSDFAIPKSVTGKPLEGMTTSLISVTESVAKPQSDNIDLKRYNVVFEACSGKDTIRLPIINIVSDSDSVDIKLVERIIPESCQVGIGKINALGPETISVQISGNSGISKQISNIETQIDELNVKLADTRSKLGELVSKKLSENDHTIAEKLTSQISELRIQLLEKKAQLNGLLLSQ